MTEREYNRFKANEWRNANLERAREIQRESYHRNRDATRDRLRDRYANDAEYRERLKANNRRSYENRKA